MSELWICREQTAKRPFCVEMDGTRLYSVEELCFYLYRNMEHLDDGIMSAPLYEWLSQEIGLSGLAETIEQEQKKGRDTLWCAWFLMREVGMYSDEELEHIKSACLAIADKDEFELQKLRADRLLMNKRYIRSIQEYEKLIHLCEANHRYVKLQGDIWHNKGVAHARLFLFQEAAECFERAYEMNHNEVSRKAGEDAKELIKCSQEEVDVSEEEIPDWRTVLENIQEDYKKKVM